MVKLIYAHSDIQSVARYTDATVLFTSGDSRLNTYTRFDEAKSQLRRGGFDPATKSTLLKFELSDGCSTDQLSAAFLTQVGFQDIASAEALAILVQGNHETIFRRASMTIAHQLRTDIEPKLDYFRKLTDYTKRAERYVESALEIVTKNGHVDNECQDLMMEFVKLVGSYNPGDKSKLEEMQEDYGFTVPEMEYESKVRKAFNDLGMALGQSISKVPHAATSEIGRLMQRFTLASETVRGANVVIGGDEEMEGLDAHLALLGLLTGGAPQIGGAGTEDDNGPRIEIRRR